MFPRGGKGGVYVPILCSHYVAGIGLGEDVFLALRVYPVLIHFAEGVLCGCAFLLVVTCGQECAEDLPACDVCAVGYIIFLVMRFA